MVLMCAAGGEAAVGLALLIIYTVYAVSFLLIYE